jgi:mRNA interferase YafQ
MKLIASKPFERKYKKLCKNNLNLKISIDNTLKKMEIDIFHDSLNAHKLSGQLKDLWAVSCGLDCRIIFVFKDSININEKVILLIDIGKHDDIY